MHFREFLVLGLLPGFEKAGRCNFSVARCLENIESVRLSNSDVVYFMCELQPSVTQFYVYNEVLRCIGLLVASSIVRKRRLGLFGHVVRLPDDVQANQTGCEAQDSVRPSSNWKRAEVNLPLPGFIRSTGTPEYR